MREVRHPPIRLPGVAALIVWFDGEASLFYRVCPPPDEVTSFGYIRRPRPPSTIEGAFPHRTGIFGTSFIRIRVHVSQQGHMRRHLFEQVVVDRRAGDVPVERNKPDGARDVPVFGVGIECGSGDVEGVRRDGTQGFCGPRPISHLYPSADEEVDSTALNHSLRRHPLRDQPVAVQRATVPVPPKDALPPALYAALQFTPGNPLADVFNVVSRVLCVSPHTSRHRGSFGEDRVGLVVAGVFEGARARPCSTHKKQDVRLRLAGGVVILYLLTYLSDALRPGLLLDERCQLSYTTPSPTSPVTCVGYLMDKNYYVYPLRCVSYFGLVTGESPGGIRFILIQSLSYMFLFHFSLSSFFSFLLCFICILNFALIIHTCCFSYLHSSRAPTCTICKESKSALTETAVASELEASGLTQVSRSFHASTVRYVVHLNCCLIIVERFALCVDNAIK